MLEHHADAGRDRSQRRAERDRPAFDCDLALIGGIVTIEHAHQRAFAGAVLAEKRENLARVNVKIDVFVGDDAAEPLDDAAHGDQRSRTGAVVP